MAGYGKNFVDTRKAGVSGVVQGAMTGFTAGKASGTIKDLNVKTKANAKADLKEMAPGYKSIGERLSAAYQDNIVQPMTNAAMGDEYARGIRAKIANDMAEGLLMFGKPVNLKEFPIDSKEMASKGFNSAHEVFKHIAEKSGLEEFTATPTGRYDPKTFEPIVNFTTKGADGKDVTVETTMKKVCEDNRFVTPYGSQKISTEMKQVGQQNIATFTHNQDMQQNARQQVAESVTRINDVMNILNSNTDVGKLQIELNDLNTQKEKLSKEPATEDSKSKLDALENKIKQVEDGINNTSALQSLINNINQSFLNFNKYQTELFNKEKELAALRIQLAQAEKEKNDQEKERISNLMKTLGDNINSIENSIGMQTKNINEAKKAIIDNTASNNDIISNVEALIAANETKNSAINTAETLKVENERIASIIKANQEIYTIKDTVTGQQISFNPDSSNNEHFTRELQKVISKELDKTQKLKPKKEEDKK